MNSGAVLLYRLYYEAYHVWHQRRLKPEMPGQPLSFSMIYSLQKANPWLTGWDLMINLDLQNIPICCFCIYLLSLAKSSPFVDYVHAHSPSMFFTSMDVPEGIFVFLYHGNDPTIIRHYFFMWISRLLFDQIYPTDWAKPNILSFSSLTVLVKQRLQLCYQQSVCNAYRL